MRTPEVNPRRTQLGRFVMYAIAFVAGVFTQPLSHDPLTGGVVFLGLFAPIDLLFEFLYGLWADYRESHEPPAPAPPGRTRREARRATRQAKAPVSTGGAVSASSSGLPPIRRTARH
jgi:hypothetical protein